MKFCHSKIQHFLSRNLFHTINILIKLIFKINTHTLKTQTSSKVPFKEIVLLEKPTNLILKIENVHFLLSNLEFLKKTLNS